MVRPKAKARAGMTESERAAARTKDLRSYYKRRGEATPEERERIKARHRAYYYANREEILLKRKAWRDANPERSREAVRQAVAKRRANDLAAARERQREATKKWRQKNPERTRIMTKAVQRRREARKKGAKRVETIHLAVLAERDGWRCHLCGKKVTKATWSMDHLVPLVAGGDHTYDNVALAHQVCNGRRGAGRLPAQLRFIG